MPPVVAWIFSIVWLGIWGALFYGFLGALQFARASRSWPYVTGSVVKVWIDSKIQPGSSNVSGRPVRLYRPRVRYTYTVGEKALSSSSIHAVETAGVSRWTSKHRAERWVGKWAPGDQVVVYHDPAKPELSALQVGARIKDWLLLVLMGLLSALAPFFLWFGLVLLAPENLQ